MKNSVYVKSKQIILLIGPQTNIKDPSKTGGIIVLFEDLLTHFKKNNIAYIVIDTNKENYSNKLIAFLKIYFDVLKNIRQVTHISLHGTANDYLLIGPYVALLSNFFNKRLSLRKFAGNFDEMYNNSSPMKKSIFNYTLKNSDINFFETKYLVSKFKKLNDNTFWFPNVRPKPKITRKIAYKKRFIFLGQVKEEKGIKEILEASNILDDTYKIDLYGDMSPDMKEVDFSKYKANYKGALQVEQVLEVLAQYDVLLLPTFWKGEGYPGVIIEALSLGIPIIATKLRGIKEMVDGSCSVLIEPKNTEELKKAIESFDNGNYQNMVENALKAFQKFNSDIQTKKYMEKIDVR